MIDFMKLRSKVHNVALEARNLSRIVDSEAFIRAWDAATDKQREELWSYVVGIDKINVRRWMQRVLSSIDLAAKPYHELRELARVAGVQYYSTMGKDDLIQALKPEEP